MRSATRAALFVAGLTLAMTSGVLAAGPTLSVTGDGSVSEAPDRASLGISLIANDDAAAVATSQNNTTYSAVVARLGKLGIAERDVRTTGFNINFVPKPEAGAQYKPPRTGYIVTRELAVTIDNLSLVGRAIDAAVAAGATQIDGVSYGLRDTQTAYAKALAVAMHDATVQAAALAAAAHLRLGPIQTLTAPRALPVSPLQEPVFRTAAAAVPTTIPPSAIEVRASVIVTYGLEP
ncbi:MAG: SIMPL domain-containing protein [Vulcanimicrobiaceae bacterium]